MTKPESTSNFENSTEKSTGKTLVHCPARVTLDQRVPREVWEYIFNRLYPSQLSRLSMVNKNFYSIVSSLSLWSRMFSSTHGPWRRLRCLRGVPESKSYMLYMCANSVHVCEQCLGQIPFLNAHMHTKPRSQLAPLPTLSTKELEYVGEPLNDYWKIKMCENCYSTSRRAWGGYSSHYLDAITKARLQWYRSQDGA